MGRFLFGLLLWGATLVGAEVSVRDTVVNGVPYIRFMKGPGHPGDLKIAKERGVLRASLEGMADSVLVVFDRNPFAQMAGRTRPLVLPPRVTPTRMVLPKATAAPLLERLELGAPAPGPEPAAPVAAAKDSKEKTEPVKPPEPDAPVAPPLPDGVVSQSEPAPLEPDVSDAPEAEPEPPTEPEPVETTYARHEPKGTFTVVIDAGHGGKDPGAIGKLKDGNDLYEKTVTLQVARKLRDALRKYKGIKVVMTRDKDEFLELSQRTKLANAAKGELFVSLHCNSIPLNSKRREEVKGFMVYLLREAKDDNDRAIERRENEAIKYETGDRAKKQSLDPVEWMMLEHQLNLYTKESERLAGLVVDRLSKEGTVDKERTGAGQAGFFVLVGALMPSVLVEMGYLSNSGDAVILKDPAKQKRIADNLAKAIDEFRRTRR
ncbi:MAG TPA: N-acetylmuramoyl-L-alanine amidase [Fibrobacteria bacterium]|nr:N-acetylmuramoyl-L-alanine amidase [Fibrobacteria bacterium]